MIWLQFAMLLPATLSIIFLPSTSPWLSWIPAGPSWLIYIFLTAIAVSRMPLWAFDLAERQIMQTSIAEKERGVVNSVEGSLTNIFTFFASLLGVIVSDPENYAVLAIVSQLAIASAAICFGIYGAKNWDKELEPNAAEEIEMWKADDNELLESPGGLFTIVDEDEE